MENQNNQVNEATQEERSHKKINGVRGGSSDYGDGGLNSHYLGNDDQISEEHQDEAQFDGSVAHGNDMEPEADQEEVSDKYHSGL